MAGKITFTMIKPDAVADGHIGAILGKISEAGFKIKAMKLTQLSLQIVPHGYRPMRHQGMGAATVGICQQGNTLLPNRLMRAFGQ